MKILPIRIKKSENYAKIYEELVPPSKLYYVFKVYSHPYGSVKTIPYICGLSNDDHSILWADWGVRTNWRLNLAVWWDMCPNNYNVARSRIITGNT